MLTKLIGIPFIDGGRDLNGCDCWGLVRLASKMLYGVELPDYMISCFESLAISNVCAKDLKSQWLPLSRPKKGCIAVMGTNRTAPDLMNHIGLVVAPGKMLHTLKKQQSHVERLSHPFYRKRIKGFWVYNG